MLSGINKDFNLNLDLSFKNNLLKKKDLENQKIPDI